MLRFDPPPGEDGQDVYIADVEDMDCDHDLADSNDWDGDVDSL